MNSTQFNTVIVTILVQVVPFIEQLCIQKKLNSDFYLSRLARIHLHIRYVATLGLRSQGRLCTIPVWSIGHMYFENEPALMTSSHFQVHPGLTCPPVVRGQFEALPTQEVNSAKSVIFLAITSAI